MSNLEVIGIVASCTRAFHNGAEILARQLEARDGGDDESQEGEVQSRAKLELEMLQKMLQKAFVEGEDKLSKHFVNEQKALRQYGTYLQEGDDVAKQELLFVAVTLQDEILDKAGHQADDRPGDVTEALQSLYGTVVQKRLEAIRSITELKQRILADLPSHAYAAHDGLNRKNSTRSMAQSFVSDAVTFSRHTPGNRRSKMAVVDHRQHLIPAIEADDIESLLVRDIDDDHYTLAKAYQSAAPSVLGVPGPSNYRQASSAASMRAAEAPIALQVNPQPPVNNLTELGPWFPPASNAKASQTLPTLPIRKRDRPSLPESHFMARTESSPSAFRKLSNHSTPSPSSSFRISEPDSAISLKNNSKKPYCVGALAAQEDFAAGFEMSRLPILQGADRRELCWKCKECDYNASDAEGQLLERVEFNVGVRFRFRFLARSHVPYTHPDGAVRSRYMYGCQFCTAEGKQTATWTSVDALMKHIKEKHMKQLTPEVRLRTKCIVGKVAEKDDEVSPGVLWDCNLADVSGKHGMIRNWMIHAVTALPT